jgi:HEAT repeat protein
MMISENSIFIRLQKRMVNKTTLIIIGILIAVSIQHHAFSQDDAAKEIEKSVQTILHNNDDQRNVAIKYIKDNLPQEAPRLLCDALISDGDTSQKILILSILKSYNLQSIKSQYIRVLENSDNVFVKIDILTLFSRSGDKSFVIPISKELEHRFAEVRRAAILALKEIGDDRMFPVIFKMAESKNPVYKMYALEALYQVYDIRLFSIVQGFLTDENKSVRIYALECVEKNYIDKLIPTIRTMALSDQNPEVRVVAIYTLGKMNDTGCQPVLFKALVSDSREIRYASAVTLWKFRFKQSSYNISEQLAVETDNQIKNVLIDSLIDMKDGGGYKGFECILDREINSGIRIKGAYALGVIGGNKTISLLIRALKDNEYKVRAEACNSLSNFKDRTVISNLLSVINDDSERYVRLSALYALEKIKDRSVVIPLYDRYAVEKDPVFKMKLFEVTRILIQSSI